MKLKTYTPLASLAIATLCAGSASAATIFSTSAGAWDAAATWGGVAPVATAGNIYVANHDLTNDGGGAFIGADLVISSTGSLKRTNSGVNNWIMNNLTIQSGGDVLSSSSNRSSYFIGGTITLEDGAELSTLGSSTRYQFDTWTVASSSTVTLDAFNSEPEFRDGPGAGTTDMSGFQGTLSVTNTQGLAQPDLQIYFDIAESDAAIQLLLKDRDLTSNAIDLDTRYQLRNGLTQWFASVDIHQSDLTFDFDGDGRYDVADGDTFAATDLSLAPGLYTKAQLDLLGFGDNFVDQGLGTGQIGVVPEPSSAALLGLGGLALIFRRRK